MPRKWKDVDWLLPKDTERRDYRPLCTSADVPGAVPRCQARDEFLTRKSRAMEVAAMARSMNDPERQMRAATALTDRAEAPVLRTMLTARARSRHTPQRTGVPHW